MQLDESLLFLKRSYAYRISTNQTWCRALAWCPILFWMVSFMAWRIKTWGDASTSLRKQTDTDVMCFSLDQPMAGYPGRRAGCQSVGLRCLWCKSYQCGSKILPICLSGIFKPSYIKLFYRPSTYFVNKNLLNLQLPIDW